MKHIHLDYDIQKDLADILSDGILDLPHLSEEAKILSIPLKKLLNGAEIKNLGEDFLDKNKRLKKVLKRRHESDPEFQRIVVVSKKGNNPQNKE